MWARLRPSEASKARLLPRNAKSGAAVASTVRAPVVRHHMPLGRAAGFGDHVGNMLCPGRYEQIEVAVYPREPGGGTGWCFR